LTLSEIFDLKQKILKSSFTENEFCFENFFLYSDKINPNILAYLRISLLTKDDVRNNTDIASYIFTDFYKPISAENEKICREVFMKEIQRKIENNLKMKLAVLNKFRDVFEDNLHFLEPLTKHLDKYYLHNDLGILLIIRQSRGNREDRPWAV
jgi:hypothetical protein